MPVSSRSPSDTSDRLTALAEGLGLAYSRGEAEQALRLCDRLLELSPDHPGALHVKGATLCRRGDSQPGLALLRRVIDLRPDYALAHADLGTALHDLDRSDEALPSLQRAVDLRPDNPHVFNTLGNALRRRERHQEVLDAFDRAIGLQANHAPAHLNRSLCLLELGRWREGFEGYEWRWRVDEFPTRPLRTDRPRWDGSRLAGKTLLLTAEQGLGDVIQFSRYAAALAARGARVLVRCQRAVADVVATVDGVAGVHVGTEPPEVDCHCPLISLPGLLGTTPERIPARVPYMSVPPVSAKRFAPRVAAIRRPRVGLVWTTQTVRPDKYPQSNRDKLAKCVPISLLGRLIAVQDVQFIALQPELAAGDSAWLREHRVMNVGPELASFADTAAVIAGLDLLISIDTSVAHLGGALAAPTWTLLPRPADWRWFAGREDSAWYPGMRLFRQPQIGDWQAVVARVATELERAFR